MGFNQWDLLDYINKNPNKMFTNKMIQDKFKKSLNGTTRMVRQLLKFRLIEVKKITSNRQQIKWVGKKQDGVQYSMQ